VDKKITAYESQMKMAELREWQSLPEYERLRAVSELSLALYRMKEPDRGVRRMQRTLVQHKREKR
jgi:hypothetical protein